MVRKLLLLSSLTLLALAGCGKEETKPSCTTDSECLSGQKCDTATGTCVAPAGRDAAAPQPDAAAEEPPDSGTCDNPCGDTECCTATQTCKNGACQECNCDGKSCGDDGCGTSCGKCSSGKTCSASGQCVTVKVDAGSGGSDAATAGEDAGVSGPDAGPVDCGATADCPRGMACDVRLKRCVTYCGATQPCNGGCCGTNGQCQATSNTSCGTTTCVDCTGAKEGHVCMGARCGCNSEQDCQPGYSCNSLTRTCSSACSALQPCNDACCTSGTCQNAATSCGPRCVNCSVQVANRACFAGACGCNTDKDCSAGSVCGKNNLCSTCATDLDCPVGMACSSAKICSTACTSTCNGACCYRGTCANLATACGATCTNCTVTPTTPACLSTGTCGCAKASDCAVGQACNRGKCGTTCDPSLGITCNGGCCGTRGSCVAGSTQTACGGDGDVCAVCTSTQVCCAGNAPDYFCTSPKLCLF